MHTMSRPVAPVSGAKNDTKNGAMHSAANVAVAGATGYAGQELLRLVARHPGGSVTAALSSGHAGAATTPAAAARVCRSWWRGHPPPPWQVAWRKADLVSLALPDAAAAELGPMLAD